MEAMHTLRIPTKEPYAYIEFTFEGTPEDAHAEYQRLTRLVQGKTEDGFMKTTTFTGEEIMYNEATHEYKSLDGKPLISGSAYKKSLEAPFPQDMAKKVADKLGVPVEDIENMWALNSKTSTSFGTALHTGLELYRKYSHLKAKEYYLPKNTTIREAVLAFPEKDIRGFCEVMVSDVRAGMVGQIDFLGITPDTGGYLVEDYKSDTTIEKNLAGHFNQLSFYAHILINKNYRVETLIIWNWDGKEWKKYTSPVLELKTK
jgi:hypothetical protein